MFSRSLALFPPPARPALLNRCGLATGRQLRDRTLREWRLHRRRQPPPPPPPPSSSLLASRARGQPPVARAVARHGHGAQRATVPARPVPALALPQAGRGLDMSGDTVITGLIGANAVVFGMWQLCATERAHAQLMAHFTCSSDGLLHHGRLHTLVTSAYSHFGWAHFGTNMAVLYFFGCEAARVVGGARFFALYNVAGAVGCAAQIAYVNLWPHADDGSDRRKTPMLGASAAVNAAVILSCCLFPSSTVLLFFVVPMPAALLGALFVAKDVLDAVDGSGSVGNAAHLGGALCGGVYWLRIRRLLVRR